MAIEPELAHIVSNYWDYFFNRKKWSPLLLGIEPTAFRYDGQHANHYTTATPTGTCLDVISDQVPIRRLYHEKKIPARHKDFNF